MPCLVLSQEYITPPRIPNTFQYPHQQPDILFSMSPPPNCRGTRPFSVSLNENVRGLRQNADTFNNFYNEQAVEDVNSLRSHGCQCQMKDSDVRSVCFPNTFDMNCGRINNRIHCQRTRDSAALLINYHPHQINAVNSNNRYQQQIGEGNARGANQDALKPATVLFNAGCSPSSFLVGDCVCDSPAQRQVSQTQTKSNQGRKIVSRHCDNNRNKNSTTGATQQSLESSQDLIYLHSKQIECERTNNLPPSGGRNIREGTAHDNYSTINLHNKDVFPLSDNFNPSDSPDSRKHFNSTIDKNNNEPLNTTNYRSVTLPSLKSEEDKSSNPQHSTKTVFVTKRKNSKNEIGNRSAKIPSLEGSKSFGDLQFDRLDLNSAKIVNEEEDSRSKYVRLSETSEKDRQLFTNPLDQNQNTHLHLQILNSEEKYALDTISQASSFEDVNVQNMLGQSPLHLAVLSGKKNVVRRLMCAGACLSIPDQNGNTPLHVALSLGYTDIARTLTTAISYREVENNGYEIPFSPIPQNLHAQNNDGQSCFDIAQTLNSESLRKLSSLFRYNT